MVPKLQVEVERMAYVGWQMAFKSLYNKYFPNSITCGKHSLLGTTQKGNLSFGTLKECGSFCGGFMGLDKVGLIQYLAITLSTFNEGLTHQNQEQTIYQYYETEKQHIEIIQWRKKVFKRGFLKPNRFTIEININANG